MRSRQFIAIPVAVVSISLLTAGCGGGGSTTAAIATSNGVLTYSHCMRSHGVPDFPAPDSSGGIDKDKIIALGDSPQFQRAETTCLHVMPEGGLGPQPTAQQTRTRLADMLSFAECMRRRGVTRFPDPTAQGELSVAMVRAQGVDVHAPAVLTAVKTCLPASHGALTAAQIRAALNDAGG